MPFLFIGKAFYLQVNEGFFLLATVRLAYSALTFVAAFIH